ncbi:response regulator [uncultured Parasphingorhabdus sp.]|uniref:response regulator n=1 Tax=uncultured Parasphingorhabdus sp. TaxID=2709694 RepID=UPI0030DB05ED|tara:strand:- start:23448 stop:24131 length:684 start_codon:yes stop_codon:yes gene_type:complete
MIKDRTIFIVEDDQKIAAILSDYFTSAGHQPQIFPDGRSVVSSVRSCPPSAIILDLMLPASDGMTICRELRKFSAVPILMLTARTDEVDKLKGLTDGADDYVTKPFSAREVVTRANTLIRRYEGRVTTDPAASKYLVDDAGKRIAWRGTWLKLSASEYNILSTMIQHAGRVFSRDQLLDKIGEQSLESGDRAIDSHIKNIRRKMASVDPETSCIASVYGAGYRFDDD